MSESAGWSLFRYLFLGHFSAGLRQHSSRHGDTLITIRPEFLCILPPPETPPEERLFTVAKYSFRNYVIIQLPNKFQILNQQCWHLLDKQWSFLELHEMVVFFTGMRLLIIRLSHVLLNYILFIFYCCNIKLSPVKSKYRNSEYLSYLN